MKYIVILILSMFSAEAFSANRLLDCWVSFSESGGVQDIAIHYSSGEAKAIVTINQMVAGCDNRDTACIAEKHFELIEGEQSLLLVRVDHGDIGTMHHWEVSEINVDLNTMEIVHSNISSFTQEKRDWVGACSWGKVAK